MRQFAFNLISMFSVLFALLPSLSVQTCVSTHKELYIYPAKNEYYLWGMETLYSGSNLQYSIKDPAEAPFFKIENPIFEPNAASEHFEPGTDMIALASLKQPANGAWLNQFAFLEEDTIGKEIDVHFAAGSAMDNNKVPEFKDRINIIKDEPFMKCFDIEYLDSETFIVDCAEKQAADAPMKNYYYIIKKNDDPEKAKQRRVETTNYKGYKEIKGREIQYHEYYRSHFGNEGAEGADKPVKLLLRGQTAWNSENGTPTNLDGNCIIEVFMVGDNYTITDTLHHLDKGQIAQDLGLPADEQATFTFSLIDFKIMPNGEIYLLDAFHGIFVYKITEQSNWKFIKQIQTYSERAYAMDVANRYSADGLVTTQLVVLYTNNIVVYENGAQKNGYTLTKAATFPGEVYISQNYIVAISNSELSLLSSRTNLLIQRIRLLSATYALNPYEPDFVAVTNSKAHRYVLSHGYLSLERATVTTEQSQFSLLATDEQKNQCEISIFFQSVAEKDTTVYSLHTDPFPAIITYPADPFPLDQIASGPNLQYKMKSALNQIEANAHVEVNVYSLWNLNITGVTLPTASDVIYSDVIIDPNEKASNKFFFLFQTKNKHVTIWDCMHEQDTDSHATCHIQDNFTAPIELSKDKTQFEWHVTYKEQLTIEFLNKENEIGLYVTHEGSFDNLLNITYPEGTKITSFTVLQDVIYVVIADQKIVDCYTGFFPTLTKFTIDEAMVKAQGYAKKWSPKRVFGNQMVKAQLIFIQSDEDVLMGDYKETFTLIRDFPIQTTATDVFVALGVHTFFIVQKGTSPQQDMIQEYNYESLNFIFRSKLLSLYDKYTLQGPLTVDFSSATGFLFVRALDTVAQKSVILVYEPNVLSHSALHQVIETGTLVEDGKPLQLSLAGGEQMFIYLNNGQKNLWLSLFRDAIMTLSPTELSKQYVTKLDAAVSIYNYDEAKSVVASYPVKFLNTQSIVKIDQTVLSNQNSQFVFVDKKDSQYIQLKNNWYSGSVYTFEIECKDCQSHLVELQNPVYHLTNGTAFDQVTLRDGVTYLGDNVMYQSDYSLIFQNSSDVQGFKHNLALPTSSYCEVLTASEDGKYIFSGCMWQDQAILYVSQCDKTACVDVEPKYRILQDVTNVGKIIYKDGVLLILNNMPSFPTSMDGNLHVFSFTIDQTNQFQLERIQVIDKKYLSSQFAVQMADFDLITYQTNNAQYYKIIISDTDSGLFFVDYYLQNKKPTLFRHEELNLIDYLNKNQVTQVDTRFYQARATQQQVKGTELGITILVTTNNIAHYALNTLFDLTDPIAGTPTLKKDSVTIPYILNQYGSWTTLNKLSVHKGFAAVPFTDRGRRYLLVAVFQLPTTTAFQAVGETIMVTMIGGEKEQHLYPHVDFVMLLKDDPAKKQTNPVLYSNVIYGRNADNYMLIKYGLQSQPVLHVQNGHMVTSQNVNIKAINDFSESSGVLKIQQNKNPDPDPDDPDNKKSSSNWWWITLIVVFGVALIGLGGFFGYKKYQSKKNVDPLLGGVDAASNGGQSIQRFA